jgi:ABC-type multidrug transport system ATPase subunit
MKQVQRPITISIHNLTKAYRKTIGIQKVTCELTNGNLHLLTGKNGSGKSTLIKCIMSLVSYEGTINKKKYRIGYAPEKYLMPDFMTIMDFLVSIGRVKDLPQPFLGTELETYTDIFQLKDKLNQPIKSLSNGMKQKVNIIQAMVNNPKILILDEPLVGLDFKAQKHLAKMIIDKSKRHLVIVATHFPEKFNTKRKVIHHFVEGSIHDH